MLRRNPFAWSRHLVGVAGMIVGTWWASLAPSHAAAPVVVGAWPELPRMASVRSVAAARIAGQPWAFVAGGASGLQVFDVAIPDSPQRVAVEDSPGDVQAVVVANHPTTKLPYACVADGDGGLLIVDVANPRLPRRMGGWNGGGYVAGVAVSTGAVAFVTDRSAGVRAIDVRVASAPKVLGNWATTGGASLIRLVGDRAYVADDGVGLRILDVSDPGSLRELGTYGSVAPIRGLAVEGRYAYVIETVDGADGAYGLSVVDVGDAAHPARRSHARPIWPPQGVTVGAGMAFVAGVTLVPVEISDPTNPRFNGGGKSTGGNAAWDVAVLEDRAYVVDRNSGLQVFSLANPAVPARQGTGYSVSGPAVDVAGTASGLFAVVADGVAGVRVLDITDPGHPGGAAGEYTLFTSGTAVGVTMVENRGYIANGESGLALVDFANPRNPRLTENYRPADANAFVNHVFVDGSTLYVAAGTAGLEIVDATAGQPVSRVGGLSGVAPAHDVVAANGYAYVAAGEQGLVVVDVTIPRLPRVIGTYDAGHPVYGVAVRANRAFVAADTGGLHVIDVTSPSSPRLVATVPLPGSAVRVLLQDAVAIVADGGGGVATIDISDSSSPGVPQRFDTDGVAVGLALIKGYLYVADESRVLVMAVPGVSPAPNVAPTFALQTNTVVALEDSGPFVLTNWVTQVSAGAPTESGQSLTFLPIQTSPPGLFAQGPTLGPDGTLRFTPATNAFGRVTCQLTLVDDGGTVNGGVNRFDQTFVIDLLPVNDRPFIDSLSDIGWREDGTGRTVELSGIYAGPKNENQQLTLTMKSDRPEYVPDPIIDYTSPSTTARIYVQSKTNWYGRVWMNVVLKDDGGTANGGRDRLETRFRVSVRQVDDAPFVTIDEPYDGTVFYPGSPIGIVITSTDAEGPVVRIEAFADDGEPFLQKDFPSETETVTWMNPPPGAHVLRVKGTDSDGLSYTSPPVRIVLGVPPSITGSNRLDLAEDSTSAPIPLLIHDNPPVPVTPQALLKVEAMSSDPLLLPPSGLKVTGEGGTRYLTIAPATNATGRATVFAVVTDGDGLTATNRITVFVNPVNDPPMVSVVAPTDAAVYQRGDPIRLEATAADVEGPVARVAFRDGDRTLVELGAPPWAWVWGDAPLGEHSLTAVATDGEGLAVTSAPVVVTVRRPPNQPPTLAGARSVVAAEDGVSDPLVLTLADDTTPAERLVFKVTCSDPALVPADRIAVAGTGATRSVTVQPARDAFGTASLVFVVEDADGGSVTNSVALTVTPVNDLPTVTLLEPRAGARFVAGERVPLLAEARDVEGAVVVEFYADDVLLGVARSAPYAWTWTNAPAGTHVVVARARDADHAVVSTPGVRFDVELPNTAPTITGVAPIRMVEDGVGGPLILTLADDRTPVEALRFRATSGNPALLPDSGIVVEAAGARRSLRLQTATNAFGSTTLEVVVEDAEGLATTNRVDVDVAPVNDVPRVALLEPEPDAVFVVGTPIRLEAVADDIETGPLAVVFFRDGVAVQAVSSPPFVATVTDTSVGAHAFTAAVTDAGGLTSTSAAVRVRVDVPANLPPTILGGGPLSLYRDSISPPIRFTLSDDHTAPEALAVRVSAADTVLFPAAGLTLSGVGGERTLTIVPAVGQSGAGMVEVIATDGEGLMGTNAVAVTVLPVSELPGGEPCFADSVPAGYGAFNVLKHAKYRQEADGVPEGTGAVGTIELRAPPTYTIRSAVVSGGASFRVNLARRDDGLFTWTENGVESQLLAEMPAGPWNTSYRLALPSGEAFNGFFPYTILTNLPPVPEIRNLTAAQTIRPDAAFTLTWGAWTGSSTNDRVLLTLVDAAGKPVVSAASDCSGQTVLPRRGGSLEIPAGKLSPGARYTGFLTFGATQLSVNDKSPLLMLRAFHSRTTEFELHTTGGGGTAEAARLGAPRIVAGNVVVAITARPGSVHRIETSRNLSAWSIVREVTLDAGGVAEVLLPLGAASEARFYRAILVVGGTAL